MVRDDNNITGLALVAYTNLIKALKVHQIRGAPYPRSAAPWAPATVAKLRPSWGIFGTDKHQA